MYKQGPHNQIGRGTTGANHMGLFGRTRIYMGPADSKGVAGGSGEGGEGGEAALNEAQAKEVTKLVNDAVNGAVTNHLTRFKKQFTEEITKTLGDALGPVSEQLKGVLEAAQKPASGKPAHTPGPDNETQQMLTRYEGRIKELEASNKAEKDAREAEKATRLREEERSSLSTALRARGLPDPQIKAAVALLHTEDKRVGRTEDGRIVFRIEKGTGAGKYVDEVDIDAGADEWLKTDEGKSFTPARPANGGGGLPARQSGQPPRNPAEAKQQATNDLAKILMGGGQ